MRATLLSQSNGLRYNVPMIPFIDDTSRTAGQSLAVTWNDVTAAASLPSEMRHVTRPCRG